VISSGEVFFFDLDPGPRHRARPDAGDAHRHARRLTLISPRNSTDNVGYVVINYPGSVRKPLTKNTLPVSDAFNDGLTAVAGPILQPIVKLQRSSLATLSGSNARLNGNVTVADFSPRLARPLGHGRLEARMPADLGLQRAGQPHRRLRGVGSYRPEAPCHADAGTAAWRTVPAPSMASSIDSDSNNSQRLLIVAQSGRHRGGKRAQGAVCRQP
jgi:hypothetical protein